MCVGKGWYETTDCKESFHSLIVFVLQRKFITFKNWILTNISKLSQTTTLINTCSFKKNEQVLQT
jgi:hypothetical protein